MVSFRGMSSNILGKVAKHSGNVAKYSRECRKTFWEMSPNFLGNVVKHSKGCRKTFWGMSSYIAEDVTKHSRECLQIFQGISLCRIAFTLVLWQQGKYMWPSGNRTRAFAGRAHCHNHYAKVNSWIIQTHYFKRLALDKVNYRPFSVLPPVSKIFERLMQKQVNEHI